MKNSGRYQLFAPGNLGKGDFNSYRMFVETALDHVRFGGWAAQVVPAGFYGGANAMAIRERLFDEYELDRIVGFVNTNEVWFPGVAGATRFCIYAARRGGRTADFEASFFVDSVGALGEVERGRSVTLPVELVKEFSSDALAVTEVRSQLEVDLSTKMYQRHPRFGDHFSDGQRPYMREVDMGNDRELFETEPPGFPVYEGRMVDQYDHRAKGYRSGRGRSAVWEELEFTDPSKSIQPQWYVREPRLPSKVLDRVTRYRVGFCDATSPTNSRTMLAALIPPGVVCGHKVPTLVFSEAEQWRYLTWLTVANSFVQDFLVRKKVALSVTYTVLDSLPFPVFSELDAIARALIARASRLTCVGPELHGFWQNLVEAGLAKDEEYDRFGIRDSEQRADVRAEIDALVAREVFGLSREELDYVLGTFPGVERAEMREYGEFRTRSRVLRAYDTVSVG
jgi:hypothetical protein